MGIVKGEFLTFIWGRDKIFKGSPSILINSSGGGSSLRSGLACTLKSNDAAITVIQCFLSQRDSGIDLAGNTKTSKESLMSRPEQSCVKGEEKSQTE